MLVPALGFVVSHSGAGRNMNGWGDGDATAVIKGVGISVTGIGVAGLDNADRVDIGIASVVAVSVIVVVVVERLETQGRWGVSTVSDGDVRAAGSRGVKVAREGALHHIGALCVEIKNGGEVVGCTQWGGI